MSFLSEDTKVKINVSFKFLRSDVTLNILSILYIIAKLIKINIATNVMITRHLIRFLRSKNLDS